MDVGGRATQEQLPGWGGTWRSHWCFFAVLVVFFFSGCAAKPAAVQQEIVLTLPEPDRQYMCTATVHLGDATREFLLPGSSADDGSFIRLGEALSVQTGKTFWRDFLSNSSEIF